MGTWLKAKKTRGGGGNLVGDFISESVRKVRPEYNGASTIVETRRETKNQ